MSKAHASWWLDDSKRWRRGSPPAVRGGPVIDADATAEPTTPTVPPTTAPSRTTPSTAGASPASGAPPAPGGPLAACSAGRRNVIERGNHPWEWYLARFDDNGDGGPCT